jgi:hypothetical protein
VEGLSAQEPSVIAVAARLAVIAGIATAFEFLVLLLVLNVLRRPMDLTFPAGAAFYQHVLVIAVAMSLLALVPWVGGLLGLVAVAHLTKRFFDGTVLAGGYVAVAMLATNYLVEYLVLALSARRG